MYVNSSKESDAWTSPESRRQVELSYPTIRRARATLNPKVWQNTRDFGSSKRSILQQCRIPVRRGQVGCVGLALDHRLNFPTHDRTQNGRSVPLPAQEDITEVSELLHHLQISVGGAGNQERDSDNAPNHRKRVLSVENGNHSEKRQHGSDEHGKHEGGGGG